jgi:hypothetical protein
MRQAFICNNSFPPPPPIPPPPRPPPLSARYLFDGWSLALVRILSKNHPSLLLLSGVSSVFLFVVSVPRDWAQEPGFDLR